MHRKQIRVSSFSCCPLFHQLVMGIKYKADCLILGLYCCVCVCVACLHGRTLCSCIAYGGQRKTWVSSLIALCFFAIRQDLSLKQSCLLWLTGQLTGEPPGSPGFSFPILKLQAYTAMSNFLCGCSGFELRSSCMHSELCPY